MPQPTEARLERPIKARGTPAQPRQHETLPASRIDLHGTAVRALSWPGSGRPCTHELIQQAACLLA